MTAGHARMPSLAITSAGDPRLIVAILAPVPHAPVRIKADHRRPPCFGTACASSSRETEFAGGGS